MDKKNAKLSPIKFAAVFVIGLSLAFISFIAVTAIIDGSNLKKEIPYLYRSFMPWRQLLVIGICITAFVLMLLFNRHVKRKWLSALVNILVIIALCNPVTFLVTFVEIPTCVSYYTIESEADFNQCADDMGIDFDNFPKYNDFNGQNVQFVGKINNGFFFYQSITAIVKYDSPELCEADYKAYMDSHQFLTKPVLDSDAYYLISAPEFHYKGIFFKVVTEGEKDCFPKDIYMIGIDREASTLYYLCLEDHDLDYMAEPNEKDLERAMTEHIADQFNLGKYVGCFSTRRCFVKYQFERPMRFSRTAAHRL